MTIRTTLALGFALACSSLASGQESPASPARDLVDPWKNMPRVLETEPTLRLGHAAGIRPVGHAEYARLRAERIAEESAQLAVDALEPRPDLDPAHVTRVFRSAALQAAASYDGDPRAASRAAGPIAHQHLPGLLAALEGRALPRTSDAVRVRNMLSRVTGEDLSRVTARALGRAGYDHRDVLDGVHRVVHWKDPVGKLRVRRARLDKVELTEKEQELLAASLRLGHATWRAGQAQGNPGEPERGRRGIAFGPMLAKVHKAALARERRRIDAYYRSPDPDLSQMQSRALTTLARHWALSRSVAETIRRNYPLRKENEAPKARGARRAAEAKTQKRLADMVAAEHEIRVNLEREAVAIPRLKEGKYPGFEHYKAGAAQRLGGLLKR